MRFCDEHGGQRLREPGWERIGGESGRGDDVIGRVTTAGAISLLHITSGFDPAEITAGPDGNMWSAARDGTGLVWEPEAELKPLP